MNSVPAQNPTNAGIHAMRPSISEPSRAGCSRLQIEAATMTPAAKPASERSSSAERLPRMTNTQAAPSVVPRNGTSRPMIASAGICVLPYRANSTRTMLMCTRLSESFASSALSRPYRLPSGR